MPNKAPAIISAVLTVIILLLFAGLSVLTQMLVLNDASERQGVTAMGISLVCQGVGVLLAPLLAGRLTIQLEQDLGSDCRRHSGDASWRIDIISLDWYCHPFGWNTIIARYR